MKRVEICSRQVVNTIEILFLRELEFISCLSLFMRDAIVLAIHRRRDEWCVHLDMFRLVG